MDRSHDEQMSEDGNVDKAIVEKVRNGVSTRLLFWRGCYVDFRNPNNTKLALVKTPNATW